MREKHLHWQDGSAGSSPTNRTGVRKSITGLLFQQSLALKEDCTNFHHRKSYGDGSWQQQWPTELRTQVVATGQSLSTAAQVQGTGCGAQFHQRFLAAAGGSQFASQSAQGAAEKRVAPSRDSGWPQGFPASQRPKGTRAYDGDLPTLYRTWHPCCLSTPPP